MPRGGTRDDEGDDYVEINNLSTLAIATFGSVRAHTGAAICEKVSKHVTARELWALW